MKTLALVLSTFLLSAGIVAGACAQSSPTAPDTKPSGEVTAPTPSGDASKDSRANDRRPDMGPAGQDAAASPRTSVPETRIFGLTPTAAVLIAAGIILVLVMGIIALSGNRTTDTRIHTDDRRL
jgi:hypothetical protein